MGFQETLKEVSIFPRIFRDFPGTPLSPEPGIRVLRGCEIREADPKMGHQEGASVSAGKLAIFSPGFPEIQK